MRFRIIALFEDVSNLLEPNQKIMMIEIIMNLDELSLGGREKNPEEITAIQESNSLLYQLSNDFLKQ
jgi:hypothetical protein